MGYHFRVQFEGVANTNRSPKSMLRSQRFDEGHFKRFLAYICRKVSSEDYLYYVEGINMCGPLCKSKV